MKAIGYVRCPLCQGLYRGYAPRHWTPGDQLCTWSHSVEDGFKMRCPGSYKPGEDTHLDGDLDDSHDTRAVTPVPCSPPDRA